MPEPQVTHHYRSSPSHDLSQTPADAGRVEDVVRCVAGLFQKGIVGQISLNSSHVLYKTGRGYTYEVSFLRGGRTLKRRFTVYQLSGIHSKSECYQVTDPKGKYMVVKIPPQSITDINTYLMAVTHERQLSKKILELGIKVVVPCVSSVMKHLHKLEFANKMSPCEKEDAYLNVLRISGNTYVEKFKVGGEYVFFMEFLDEPFLGKVVREFYDKEMLTNLKKEYFESDLVLLHNRDRIGFNRKHKHIGSTIYLNEIYDGLQETFEFFCAKVDSLSSLYSIPRGVFKKINWFVARYIGNVIDESSFLEHWDSGYGDKNLISNRFNMLLNQLLENSVFFNRYLEVLDQEARWTAFKYSAGKMKMIGNNLLILLVLLEKMGLVLIYK